jgi:hypothetical protein
MLAADAETDLQQLGDHGDALGMTENIIGDTGSRLWARHLTGSGQFAVNSVLSKRGN